MKVEVVAVGTELLLGQIVDTNSSWIGEQLALAGLDSHYQTKVGDNPARIREVLLQAPFTTYLKPGYVKDPVFQRAVDSAWKGTLPYSVLYVRGVKKKAWHGTLDFDAVAREVAELCR